MKIKNFIFMLSEVSKNEREEQIENQIENHLSYMQETKKYNNKAINVQKQQNWRIG